MSKSMVQRWLTAGVLIPTGALVIFLPLWNGILVLFAVLSVGILTTIEIYGMTKQKKLTFHPWMITVFSTFNIIAYFLYGIGLISATSMLLSLIALMVLFIFFLFARYSGEGRFEKAMENIGIATMSYILIAVFFPVAVLLKTRDLSGWLLSMPLAIAWMSDAGGLFIGKWLGRTPLTHLSSPKKTVEGYVGVFLFAELTAALFFLLQSLLTVSTHFSFAMMMVIGALISLTAAVGDLAESTFKRWAGVKDSSNMLPGHGGFFDLLDSVLISLPAFYVLIRFLGY